MTLSPRLSNNKNAFTATALPLLLLGVFSCIAHAQTSKSRNQIGVNDFTLIGGYVVPHDRRASLDTSRSPGNFYFYRQNDRAFLWMVVNGTSVMRFLVPPVTSTAEAEDAPARQWPVLIPDSAPFEPYSEVLEKVGDAGPSGLFYDAKADRLWVSGRAGYAAPVYHGPWLSATDHPTSPDRIIRSPMSIEGTTMQGNGGGFVELPLHTAIRFFGGRTLGLASGGYQPGQGSLAGPSLTLINPSQPSEQPLTLLRYGAFNGTMKTREFRPDDYTLRPKNVGPKDTPGISWAEPPREGIGRWFASSIKGNPAWIESGDATTLAYFVTRGTGDIFYKRHQKVQTEGFGVAQKTAVYFYDADDLIDVVKGSIGHNSVHARIEDWPITPGIGGVPRGAQFDASRRELLVVYERALGKTERQHVIARFRLELPMLATEETDLE
ncbi:secreted protein [Rhodopirellula sp. SWK7]|nr:secreted protein [Rhodopirellula sp. SWK7]